MNRVGLKLACLAVSLVIWIRVATTVETEATIALPVMLENLGAEYTSAGSDLPEMVQVSVAVVQAVADLAGAHTLHRVLSRSSFL